MASALSLVGGKAVGTDGPDLDPVKGAVVVVVAKGTVPALGNAPAETHGTGFFISKEGYLVTSYHLRAKLGAVDDGTVSYEVHFGPAPSDYVINAAPFWESPTSDLLVLYAATDRIPAVLQRGNRDGIALGITPVYTAGYPKGYPYSIDQGIIKSFYIIDPIPAWQTSLTFKEGQSGSPILRADGTVVAVAKGNDKDAATIGIIVPVRTIPDQYWDTRK